MRLKLLLKLLLSCASVSECVSDVYLGPGDIVLDGAQLPQEKRKNKGHSPQCSAQEYCGQTVARLTAELLLRYASG